MHRKACAMYEFAVMEDGRLKVVIGTAWRRSSNMGNTTPYTKSVKLSDGTGVDDKRLLPRGREREWVWRLDLGKRAKALPQLKDGSRMQRITASQLCGWLGEVTVLVTWNRVFE